MKITSNQIIFHDEHLSQSQMVTLLQRFMLRLSEVWLKEQNLSEEDLGYVITKVKEGERIDECM